MAAARACVRLIVLAAVALIAAQKTQMSAPQPPPRGAAAARVPSPDGENLLRALLLCAARRA